MGVEAGLLDRLGRGGVAAGDEAWGDRQPALVEVGEPELGGVPGHVGVVPAQPGELRAVGREPGTAVEVGAGDEFDGWLRGGGPVGCGRGQRNRDQGGDLLAARGVGTLLDGEQAAAVRVGGEVGVVGAVGRGQGDRRAGAGEVDALVLEVDEGVGELARAASRQRAWCGRDARVPRAEAEGAAAVLVDAAADVVAGRRQCFGGAVRPAADEHVAPAFVGAPLDPADAVAGRGDVVDAACSLGDAASRDRRRPGAVGGRLAVARPHYFGPMAPLVDRIAPVSGS